MRRQIGKPITNEDLYAGCRRAFENGFSRVKLYFMCGLPGERRGRPGRHHRDVRDDLAAGQGGHAAGSATVVANVSNFVPKPQTPYQWNAMQRREYFREAHELPAPAEAAAERAAAVPRHRDEPAGRRAVPRRPPRGRGDRAGLAARRPVRRLGRTAPAASSGGRPWPTPASTSNKRCTSPAPPPLALPWDHIGIRQGRGYLEREHAAAAEQLRCMCQQI